MEGEHDALVAATEARILAQTAIEGQSRIEQAIETMRQENSSQHAEGRRNLMHMARGLHRRHDRQGEALDQLRKDMDVKFASAASGAQTDRRHLHGRINALTWSLLGAAITCGVALLGAIGWLMMNPVRLLLP